MLLEFEDVRIIFTNFSGTETDMNAKGKRNFCIVLDNKEDADELARDGWNVKVLPPREDGDEPTFFIKINVNYDSRRPPRIKYRNSRGMNKPLSEETVGMLDSMSIVSADVVVNPYEYNPGHLSGYVQSMRVIVKESRLEAKWDDEDDSATVSD